MGRGSIQQARITVEAIQSNEPPARPGTTTWDLTVITGPLMFDHDPSTRITLTITGPDGVARTIALDPDAPTLETLTLLGTSGIPELEALFPNGTNLVLFD